MNKYINYFYAYVVGGVFLFTQNYIIISNAIAFFIKVFEFSRYLTGGGKQNFNRKCLQEIKKYCQAIFVSCRESELCFEVR